MRDIPKNDKNKITKRSQKSEKTNSKKNFKNIKNSNNRKAIDCPVLKIGVPRKLKKKVEITEESPLEDLTEEIRFRIWEKKRHMLREIIEIIGPKIAIELANQVAEIELKVKTLTLCLKFPRLRVVSVKTKGLKIDFVGNFTAEWIANVFAFILNFILTAFETKIF